MDRDSSWQGQRLPRWIAAGLSAGLPLFGVGCTLLNLAEYPEMPPAQVQREQPRPSLPSATTPPVVQPVSHAETAPTVLPAIPATASAPMPALPAKPAHEVPIELDTVFRLAEQQNPRIALARERLHESLLNQSQKSRLWLPNMYAGIGYFRHEGGIQDQDGRLIHSSTGALAPGLTLQTDIDMREATFQEIESQRRVAQEKVSLSQVNNEVLLEAALAYVDLLTTRRGEAIARDLETYDKKLLERAEKMARSERSAAAVVEAIKASLTNRRQTMSQLRQQAASSSAKLVYLLGLPPETVLVPIDPVIAPVDLVDVAPGTQHLISLALTNGPGVHELENILGLIQLGLDKSQSIHNLLPSLQVNAYEGAFGAGPGGSLAWDNRLDVQVQLRWNITQLCQSDFQRTVARSKQTQALLNRDDLHGKLAAGVIDATETILAGREQIGLSASQIRHASEGYRLTNRRLEEGLQSALPSDVLLSIRSLEQAHFNHLSSISAHNKAQIRLLLLLGGSCPKIVPPTPPESHKAAEVKSPESKTRSPRPLQLPIPTSQGAPVNGGPDGSIFKVYPR